MDLFYGLIKINQEFLSAHPYFTTITLIVTVLALTYLTLGKPIKWLFQVIRKGYAAVPRIRKIEDWIAICITRRGWSQKGDAKALNLEGKYLKELSFVVDPLGSPKNWRAGFMIGSPAFSPNSIVDNLNAITCHAGAPPKNDGGMYIWLFDKDHSRNNPYSTLVKHENKQPINFLLKINNNNHLTIQVQGQVVYSERIDATFRKRAYLIAWGDEFNCKVKFTNVIYYI